MIRKIYALILGFGVLAIVAPAWATSDVARVAAPARPSGQEVSIPNWAVEVAPHVFNLGTAVDPKSGKTAEGYAFVHYKKDLIHKPRHNG